MRFSARHIFIQIVSAVLMMVAFVSCIKEEFEESTTVGKGSVSPTLTVEFEPIGAALTRASGYAIKEITSLSVIVYKADNTLYGVFNYGEVNSKDTDRDKNDANTLPFDYDRQNLSESNTPKATLTLPQIPLGSYYMYVVANMGALPEDKVQTPEMLKSIQVSWNTGNIPSNNQMFGYFTEGTNGNSEGFDAPMVTINASHTQFHAWVKRCASKLTIVYDGSGLHNDIFVYIHKATIRDIPKTCYLGQTNKPESTDELWSTGESIYYNSSNASLETDPAPMQAEYLKWMRIGKGSSKKGAVGSDGTLHPEDAMALYFYENAQGKFPVTPEDSSHYKPQIWHNVGTNVIEGMNDYKDNVKCGTYVEVEGYYVSKHAPGISQGKIKYRFMLGQDLISDYNAYRNRHYKLTLKFNGYANQADWHIEYVEETPEIYTPDEFYVSYLYNKQHTLPLRIVGNCTALEVEIIRNDWNPYDPESPDEAPVETIENGDETFKWNRQVWSNSTSGVDFYYGKQTLTYSDTTLVATPPHAGFLSLTVPTAYRDPSTELPPAIFCTSGTHWYSYQSSIELLKKFYEGNCTGQPLPQDNNTIKQNKRTLNITTEGIKGVGRNSYTVNTLADNSKLVQIPLWTRPLSMINISGFSGNNPYEAYQRKALLRIRGTFTLQDGSIKHIRKTVPIYQVRRIINPKAIWRKYDNNTRFHVALMQRRDAKVSDFETFVSEGPWRATITTTNGTDFCYLEGTKDGNSVVGDTDETIEFDVCFRGVTGALESNCAIITVMYHGETCEHTIFVRQGYDEPLEIVTGSNVKWSSYSLYAAYHSGGTGATSGRAIGIHTKSPLALGSLFKRGNYNQAILVKNNDRDGFGKLQDIGTKPLYLYTSNAAGSGVTSSDANWGSIEGIPYNGTTGNKTYQWCNFKIGTRVYSLPTMNQYLSLETQAEVGFGVMYGGGAERPATTFADAFGYKDHENQGLETEKGMRGVVVYNESNANQIFFPMGANGVGRRTIQGTKITTTTPTTYINGVLRYGAVNEELSYAQNTDNQYRPICYNLPNNAGAIYWAKNALSNGNLAWDMNFADLNFAPYDYACAYGDRGGSGGTYGDALPIKLVYVGEVSQ